MRQNRGDRLSVHDRRGLNVAAMISLKQLTQLAATSTEVWQVFQADAGKAAGTDATEATDAKERAEIQVRRSRNLLWELSSRLKGLSDEATANPAIRARMLADNALRLERLDPRILALRDDKNRHAQLIREYQSTFDSLRLNLGEDSMRTMTDTFHYPERIYALGEFVKLRREKAGLESRAMGIEKKIEEAREESAEAEKESACVEAFLRTRKAQKGSAIALGVARWGWFSPIFP